jgi:predicted lipoprotein with Yx(FWY)xxD motif
VSIRRPLRRSLVITAALALTLAACGGDDATEEPADQVTAEEPAEEEAAEEPADEELAEEEEPAVEEPAGDVGGAELAVADSDLGEILVDGEGMSLYRFDPDEQGDSTCYDDCEATWPPLEGPVTAGEGVDESLIGETERTDGTVQATYDSWPLYYYGPDSAAGDVTGQGVGEVWWVLAPDGSSITEVPEG